jgi:hypothetical protein
MSERPGTKEARELFNSPLKSLDEWINCLQRYSVAVAAVSKGKSIRTLVQDDCFLWTELYDSVKSRNPNSLKLCELSVIMRWKLARGKARPLQKLVDSNAPETVEKASKQAFEELAVGNWEKAINSISVLKGIGVATATAVFAPFAPEIVPFMADEVMEASTTCKRDYTMKVYKVMRDSLVNKAAQLQKIANEECESKGNDAITQGLSWNAENVGKALWVKAMMAVYPEISSDKRVGMKDTEVDNKEISRSSRSSNDSATLTSKSTAVNTENFDSDSAITTKNKRSQSTDPIVASVTEVSTIGAVGQQKKRVKVHA